MKRHEDRVIAGIDVSKRRLDVHVAPSGGVFSVATDRAGLEALVERLQAAGCGVAGLEASGGYERRAIAALTAAGIEVRLLDPVRVRRFAGALGLKAKNDPLDASLIARFVGSVESRPVIPDEARQAVRRLVAYRRQLSDQLVMIGNQRPGLDDPDLVDMSDQHRALLLRQIDCLERRLQALVDGDPGFAESFALLRSVPGVGPVLAWTIIAELPEIGSLGRHPLAALVGVAPYDRDSGAQHGKRHIFGGRKGLRNVLYMATLAAIRCNPAIKRFHRRLIDNGKPQKLAITACMRKLVITLNAIIRDQKPWQTINI